MKSICFLLPLATTFLAVLESGRGQSSSIVLGQSSITAQAGEFVSIHGTIRNDGTTDLFLNADRISLSLRGVQISPVAFDLHLDESPFVGEVPTSLGPGEEWTGNLFRVKVGLDATPASYDGSFSLLGGAGPAPVDPVANAGFDLTVAGTAPSAGPAAPTALTVTPAETNLMLEWIDHADNEEGFRIEQSVNGGDFSVIALVGIDRTWFSVKPADPANNYFFRVRAFNGFDTLSESDWSNVALGRLVQPTPPALVPWNAAEWTYMNPMGGPTFVLPPRPADGTADPDFDTTWFLPEETFATQYDGPTFGASPALTGTPGDATTYDSGVGSGPLGFPVGGMAYFGTAGAEFTQFDTNLTVPSSEQQRTSYYRRTFTVPEGGLISPTIRYLIDDAAYFYLDGVLVATVNIAPDFSNPDIPVADVFNSVVYTAGNDVSIDTLDLSGPIGTVPGTTDARIWATVPSLAAGTHTLAVSIHNAIGSAESCLAVELGERPPEQTVFIAASDPSAQLATPDSGAFVIARSGDIGSPLTVNFEIAIGPGQAQRDTRYALAPDSLAATFPAGVQSATIEVNPLADTAVLGTQNVTLTLLPGSSYFLGEPVSATVELLDSPLNEWKVQQFGSLAAAQGPAADDDATPAGDGVTNLMKYALGLDPLVPSAGDLPRGGLETFDDDAHLVLEFTRPVPAPAGISYHVECTEGLADSAPWTPAELVPGYPVPDGENEILKYRDPEPRAGRPRDFIRLRITRP